MQQTNLWSSDYRSNWNLEVLVFVEGAKPENPEENPGSKDENPNSTHMLAGPGIETRSHYFVELASALNTAPFLFPYYPPATPTPLFHPFPSCYNGAHW